MNQSDLKPAYSALIISLLAICSFLTLLLLRSLDDNRLTSWQWVFANIDLVPIFPILILGLTLAYVLSRLSFLERHPVFLFLPSFFIAAIFWRVPEVIVDASRYFTQAKHIKVYGIGYFFNEWGRDIMVWTDLPLVPFIYGLIFKFFGEDRLYIQIFTTLLFSLTVVLTYMIGKTLWDKQTGFVGGLLLLGIPYLYSQVPLMLVDIPTMFFLTLSIFTIIKTLKQGGVGFITISSIALLLTFFSKYSTWLWLTVLFIIFMVFLKTAPKEIFKRGNFRSDRASYKLSEAWAQTVGGEFHFHIFLSNPSIYYGCSVVFHLRGFQKKGPEICDYKLSGLACHFYANKEDSIHYPFISNVHINGLLRAYANQK
jgi:hypothetical protein